jgi:hypothetical protein
MVIVGYQGQGQQMHHKTLRVVLVLGSVFLSESHYWPCWGGAWPQAVLVFVHMAAVGPHAMHLQSIGSDVDWNLSTVTDVVTFIKVWQLEKLIHLLARYSISQKLCNAALQMNAIDHEQYNWNQIVKHLQQCSMCDPTSESGASATCHLSRPGLKGFQ